MLDAQTFDYEADQVVIVCTGCRQWSYIGSLEGVETTTHGPPPVELPTECFTVRQGRDLVVIPASVTLRGYCGYCRRRMNVELVADRDVDAATAAGRIRWDDDEDDG